MPGIYAADGSHNVTIVSGGTVVGAVAPDGSRNVTVVNSASPQLATQTLGTWYMLGSNAVQASHTGSLSETVLKTLTIPAGSMGPNGVIRVTYIASHTNSANNKIIRVRLGGLSGTIYMSDTVTTTSSTRASRMIHNRNSQASQISFPSGVGGFGPTGSALITGTVNTAVAQDLVITALLADVGETIAIEAYTVEVLYKA